MWSDIVCSVCLQRGMLPWTWACVMCFKAMPDSLPAPAISQHLLDILHACLKNSMIKPYEFMDHILYFDTVSHTGFALNCPSSKLTHLAAQQLFIPELFLCLFIIFLLICICSWKFCSVVTYRNYSVVVVTRTINYLEDFTWWKEPLSRVHKHEK